MQLALDCDKVSDLEGSDDLADCEDDDEEEGDEGEADELDENRLKMGTPDNLYDLNSLLTFIIVAPLLALIQIFIHFYWPQDEHSLLQANHASYQEEKKKRNAKLSEEEEAALEKKLAIKEMEKKQRARRTGRARRRRKRRKTRKPCSSHSGVFVFPSLLTLCCTFFMTGLVGSSVELLAECAMDYSPLVMAACPPRARSDKRERGHSSHVHNARALLAEFPSPMGS